MVELQNISFSYRSRGSEIPVFSNLNCHFRKGRITAVLGPSGCGKTTLLRIIAGLLSPGQGSVTIDGQPLPGIRKHTAFMFQDYGLLPWLTVERNASLGLEAQGVSEDVRNRRVAAILEELGLLAWRHAYPARLSGGMQQRVALARAFATEADLILMDEPFSSLDALTRESLQDMLASAQRNHGTTIILVTHSIEEAAFLADEIVVFSGSVPAGELAVYSNPRAWLTHEGSERPPREHHAYLETVGELRALFDRMVVNHKPETSGSGHVSQQPGPAAAGYGAERWKQPALRTAQMLAAAMVVTLAWAGLATLLAKPFLPAPAAVYVRLAQALRQGTLTGHVLISLKRVLLSLLAAGVPAWALGLLAGRIPALDHFLSPLLYLFHPLPKVAFLPLLMLFLGLGDASKIALMGLVIFGQLFVSARDAAKRIAPVMLDSVRTLGGGSLGTLRWVILPSTLPELFSALRVSLGTSIAVLFLSETFASVNGLGWYIMDAWSRIDYPDMYASIVALSLFGLVLYLLLDLLETAVIRWRA
ncbi:MAG: ATP-binding cassette domain-containing protein [Spirochaetaceae bacterium]|nr:ATP-binding cassette domain-containing protein [Spirochaetaceae bacterium]